MSDFNPSLISPPTLAYLGDSVLEIMVREHLVLSGIDKVAKLNDMARDFVTAKSQSAAVELMLPLLDENEYDIFRRGRNISHLVSPKSASAAEYRRATGLECLFGYLHLTGKSARIKQLFDTCFLSEKNVNNSVQNAEDL